jgi:uncharacterized cupredoxin-like copper-binding protein
MTRLNLMLGALLLTAAAQPGIDWSQAKPMTVLMVDDSFVPDRLNLLHGVPYRLHMENHGKDLHEFTAPEFLANATVRDPDVLANAGAEVVVHPGQMVDVFLVPMKAGKYRLTCADHDWDGMVGEIVVD